MLLQNFIRSVLSERSRYEKETGRTVSDDIRDKLMSLASETHPAPYTFTMTDVERIGINPKTGFETPAGVYFYPLTVGYCQKLFDNKLPFAGDRKFVGIVKLRGLDSGRWLKFLRDQTDFQTNDDYDRVANAVGKRDELYASRNGIHNYFNIDSRIFDMTWAAARTAAGKGQKQTVAWNKILRDLGYIGIYDAQNGIIHRSEPMQCVCLSPAAYEIVDILETKEIRKIRDLTSKEDIEAWVSKLSTDQKYSYANLTKTSAAVLAALANDGDIEVLPSVAINDKTPPEILRMLSQNPDIFVKYGLAANRSTPPDVLRKIFQESRRRSVMEALANNTATPVDILQKIAADIDDDIPFSSIAVEYAKSTLKKLELHKLADV